MSSQFDLKTKPALFTFGFLSLISVIAHANFTDFKPKALIPLEEVQGVKDQNNQSNSKIEVNIPYPDKYEILGVSETERTTLHTFKTTQSQQEVQNFYKNVLKAQDWQIENEGTVENFLNSEYKKDKARIKISALKNTTTENKNPDSTQEKTPQNIFQTVVTIEILQRN